MASLAEILQLVEAKNLACVRGGRSLFRDVSFRVEAGKTIALEGPNGSGKSSTLRMLAGLLPQAEGAIRFRTNRDDIVDNEERGKYVAWLGDRDGIKGQLSVSENLAFFANLHDAKNGAREVLERFNLGHAAELPASFLSAGQKRRLALARLLFARRPLWLLDEPFSALDKNGRALVASLIDEHCATGGISIVATHETLPSTSASVVLGAA